MNLTVPLSADETIALNRAAAELGIDLPEAAQAALRDWLIGHGHLELPDADNDNAD
ncbi:hypothetical protein [Mesorhizobium sp. CAU 1741]|uniref:hypothetical protein n=1 Tax=Mesorhizobium sp. CAU 1741 TaxID=3140366 RepID=UPI00325A5FFE